MKTMLKLALMAGAAWSATAATAVAQDAAPAGANSVSVEEVLVTARRREESLKDVPVAVSAFSAETLERIGASDITTLQQTTPNLTLQVARGSNSTVIAFIRGVGQQDPLWGFEPGVGLYIDDVYIARPQGAVLDVYDVERVEVLRGPQGTLYGRNTIGGAIKYVTRKISGEPEFNIRGVVGSYGQHDEIASVKGKLNDQLGLSLALGKFDRNGYGKNLNTGAEQYDKNVLSSRATLEYSPTEALFFRLSGDYLRDTSNPRHGRREVQAISIFGANIPGGAPPAGVYDTNAGSGDYNHVITKGVSLLGEWTVNENLTFKSISAYRSGSTNGTIDFDELPGAYLDVPAQYLDHQFSQELQLVYASERLQGVAGVYYMSATAAGAFDTVVSQINTTTATSGWVDTESWAAFADVSYDLSDKLSISVGGRYTKDDKTGHVYRQNFTGLRSPLFGNNTAVPGLLRSNFTNSKSFEKFTPRVSLRYKFDDDRTGYVSYSQGFKSGGFDMRGDVVLTPDTQKGYEPETVDTAEAGLKGSFFDHRLMLNSAVFYSKYKDQQVTLQTPIGGAIASQVLNVGKSHIYGVEFEGVVALTQALSANFSLGYVKAEYDEYLALDLTATPPVKRDFADSRVFQNTPEWVGNVGLVWRKDLGDRGSVTVAPMASYRGDASMFEIPTILDQKAYWLYDASIAWVSPDGGLKVALQGKNLSDERYRVGGYNFPYAPFPSSSSYFANSVSAFYGPPRTYSVSVSAKF